MEDSKILWYIVLGAIYFLSKAFAKKKKKEQPQPTFEEDYESEPEKAPEKPQPTSFDEILKELSKEVGFDEEEKKQPETQTIAPEKPLVSESNDLPSYSRKEEVIKPLEKVEIERSQPVQREKPEYKRSSKFAIKEEKNETAESIHELLSDVDGTKKAIILSEILNRKY